VSRYAPLTELLTNRPEVEVILTFAELSELIGALPPSARLHLAWWANSVEGHAHAAAWLDAGRLAKVDFLHGRVTFTIDAPEPRPRAAHSVSAPVELTQTIEGMQAGLHFAWMAALDITLAGGRLAMPRLPSQPGIYRFTLNGEHRIYESYYVGESDNLVRRPTQPHQCTDAGPVARDPQPRGIGRGGRRPGGIL
jgi:hypothetical protein